MAQHGTTTRTIAQAGPPRGATAIPDKLYFRIGEVAKLCAVPAYVLRFWESEFPQLKPNKGGTGQRLYRRKDVEMALRVKTLLYDEGFTIPGARQALKVEQRQKEPQLTLAIAAAEVPAAPDRKALRRLQREMQELLELLGAPQGAAEASSQSRAVVHPIRAARGPRTVIAAAVSTPQLFD